MSQANEPFLAGVIEGFYGPLWSREERLTLLDLMAAWGLNTYLYAPKDDLKHRLLWREYYAGSELDSLDELIAACRSRGLRFIYALSPGLDIRYAEQSELACLQARFEQLISLGCEHFALLLDDIPDAMHPADRGRWDSFAEAQCYVANAAFGWVRHRLPAARFLFCPTPYCGRMHRRRLGGDGYLETIGARLDPAIDIFWTGPEIISREISVEHIRQVQQLLGRRPLLWDNLHANDYDGRRMYCGPYSGRPLELRDEVTGILLNPNCEFPVNYVPIHTLADYLKCRGGWDARQAYLSAMAQWHHQFASAGRPIALDDLILLGDCFYLPYEEGPGANDLLSMATALLGAPVDQWSQRSGEFEQLARRLREVCAEIANLRDRRLFAALCRRTWELREEIDLMLACIGCRRADATGPLTSDFHLPRTYRGGLVPRLQRLLQQNPDGTFEPSGLD